MGKAEIEQPPDAVEAEFESILDAYIQDWTQQVKQHVTNYEAGLSHEAVIEDVGKIRKAKDTKAARLIAFPHKISPHNETQLTEIVADLLNTDDWLDNLMGVYEAADDAGKVMGAFEDAIDLKAFVEAAQEPIAEQTAASGRQAYATLKIDNQDLFDALNTDAIDYAHDRAAEMVGMKWVDGELIENPRAEWAITETTRDSLRSMVENAYREGLTPAQLADQIQEAHAFSDQRSEMIARTEMAKSSTHGTLTALKESGVVTGKRLLLSDDHSVDDDCDLAADMDTVDLDDDFDGLGDPPLHPLCVAGETIVSATGVSAGTKRIFKGRIAVISTRQGRNLRATFNHPMLTGKGWVGAGLLQKGDQLVCEARIERRTGALYDNIEYGPAKIEDIVETLLLSQPSVTREAPITTQDFHGDVAYGDVAIVVSNRKLRTRLNPSVKNGIHNRLFTGTHHSEPGLAGFSSLQKFGGSSFLAQRSMPALPADADLKIGLMSDPELQSSRSITDSSSPFDVLVDDSGTNLQTTVNIELARSIISGEAGPIEFDEVVDVGLTEFSGHVYNLDTSMGFYSANGIIVHNCECAIVGVVEGEGGEEEEE